MPDTDADLETDLDKNGNDPRYAAARALLQIAKAQREFAGELRIGFERMAAAIERAAETGAEATARAAGWKG